MKIVIPGEPRTKKNSQQILVNKATGRPFIMPSKEAKAYSKLFAVYAPKLKEPISEPVNIQCLYFRSTKRRVDLINLLEMTADCLVECGIISDDNRNVMYSVDGSRVFLDRESPRVEITIEPVTEEIERWTD